MLKAIKLKPTLHPLNFPPFLEAICAKVWQ